MTEQRAALFIADDADLLQVTPTELTRGPWQAHAQHGGPPSALLGLITERQLEADEFLAHIEIELTRPVPLLPLETRVRRERVSGRVTRIHAELHHGEHMVSRSNALVLRRTTDVPPPAAEDPAVEWPPLPDESATYVPEYFASGADLVTYHRDAVTHRFTHGSFEPGAAHGWVRLKQPVVDGIEPSGFQRTLAAADFGSGISAIFNLATSGFGLINANLSVTFEREPVGEWIGIDSRTSIGPQGTGTGITRFGDEQGVAGVATQSLLGYRP